MKKSLKINRVLLLGLMLAAAIFIISFKINIYAEEYEYDELGRVTKVTYEDGSSIEYEYDKNGNILKTTIIETSSEAQTTSTESEPYSGTEEHGGNAGDGEGVSGEAGNGGNGEDSTGEAGSGGNGETEAEVTGTNIIFIVLVFVIILLILFIIFYLIREKRKSDNEGK